MFKNLKKKSPDNRSDKRQTPERGATLGEILANKIMDGFRQARLIARRFNLATWIENLNWLLDKSGGGWSQTEARAVVDWYLAHMGKEGVPAAHTAKAFIAMRARIRQAWLDDPKAVAPSVQAQDVCALSIEEQNWCSAIQPILPAVIQRSMDAYQPWQIEMYAALAKLTPKQVDASADWRLFRYLDQNRFLFPDARDFVRFAWMRILFAKVGWQNNSKVSKLVWGPESIVFMEAGEEMAFDYSGEQGRFKKLLGRCRNEKQVDAVGG